MILVYPSCCCPSELEQFVETFTADGTFACPSDVTQATVECWGAGGYGIGDVGGGGGEYRRTDDLTVVASRNYTIQVGVQTTTDADGEDSFFQDSVTATKHVIAKGGESGSNGGSGGTGGTGATGYKGGDSSGENGGGSGGDSGQAFTATGGTKNGAPGATLGLAGAPKGPWAPGGGGDGSEPSGSVAESEALHTDAVTVTNAGQ